MSFSSSVKEEIVQSVSNKEKEKACLLGMLTFCKIFSPDEIILQTENKIVAHTFSFLINQAINSENAVSKVIVKKKNNVKLFSLSVRKQSDRQVLFDYFNIDHSYQNGKIDISKIGKKKLISFFVAGAFLVCGSVNDPLKEYHLEFVTVSSQLCNSLAELLSDVGIVTKKTERKNYFILYIKESENIEDMLTFMGAPKCSLEIMNVKILKDVRNKINRAVNCDSANIEKTLNASEKQIADIEFIDKKMGLANLRDELREIAELRLENPDWNLKELAENLNPPISRSGANHRLVRIKKIAEEMKG